MFQSNYQRSKFDFKEPFEYVDHLGTFQDEAVICSCTTDNCNKDNNCDCIPPTNIICQKCDGENGECESTSDNGKSVICAEDEDACFYHSISKTFSHKFLSLLQNY